MLQIEPDRSKKVAPRLEDFDQVRTDLADIKDLLSQLRYTGAHADPRHAPTTPRPDLPWESHRDRVASAKSVVMRSIMLPWEIDADQLEEAKSVLLEEISKGR